MSPWKPESLPLMVCIVAAGIAAHQFRRAYRIYRGERVTIAGAVLVVRPKDLALIVARDLMVIRGMHLLAQIGLAIIAGLQIQTWWLRPPFGLVVASIVLLGFSSTFDAMRRHVAEYVRRPKRSTDPPQEDARV